MVIAHIRSNFAAAFFPRMSEWAAAIAVFGIGLVLLVNEGLMAAPEAAKAYGLMLMVASQAAWANGLILFGGLRLVVLAVNGAWRRSPHARSVMAILSCFPLYTIAISLLPAQDIAMVLAFVVLGMDTFNAVRAAGDARIVDHAHARGLMDGGQQQRK